VDVELAVGERIVKVMIAHRGGVELRCAVCGTPASRYDSRQRSWRHLDTMQYETHLIADVPRTNCSEHGVHQVNVPWAERGSRFTAMFESLVIDWLREASTRAVARLMGMSWDEVDGIMARAVKRGLQRRRPEELRVIGVDEKAFRKRHEYVTVVCNALEGTVVHVADDRKAASLADYYTSLTTKQRAAIQGVAMDMWGPYITATERHLPHALIVFDRFHISRHLVEAVDKVRRREHRELLERGDRRLAHSKYLWLKNVENLSPAQAHAFTTLRSSSLRVARAYALKETARYLWNYASRAAAHRAWKSWMAWAQRSRLAPMVEAARMIRRHFDGVLNAVVTNVTNAVSEGLNSRIQALKHSACGYRSIERFKLAIYFHLGGLDLYPCPST
jgi:transposase